MNNPVKHCQVYKQLGCSHVDGFLCDYPDCSMLKEHFSLQNKIKDIALDCIVEYPSVMHWVFTHNEFEKFIQLVIKELNNETE